MEFRRKCLLRPAAAAAPSRPEIGPAVSRPWDQADVEVAAQHYLERLQSAAAELGLSLAGGRRRHRPSEEEDDADDDEEEDRKQQSSSPTLWEYAARRLEAFEQAKEVAQRMGACGAEAAVFAMVAVLNGARRRRAVESAFGDVLDEREAIFAKVLALSVEDVAEALGPRARGLVFLHRIPVFLPALAGPVTKHMRKLCAGDEPLKVLVRRLPSRPTAARHLTDAKNLVALVVPLLKSVLASGKRCTIYLRGNDPASLREHAADVIQRAGAVGAHAFPKSLGETTTGRRDVVSTLLREAGERVVFVADAIKPVRHRPRFYQHDDVDDDSDNGEGGDDADDDNERTSNLPADGSPSIVLLRDTEPLTRVEAKGAALIVTLPPPSDPVRRARVRERLAPHGLPESVVERLASKASPSEVTATVKLAALVERDGGRERLLSLALDERDSALGRKSEASATRRSALAYDASLVASDVALASLVRGLRRTPRAAMCFYGPPGAGKTAAAGFVAEQLGRPLLVFRGSDLLSMWVGATEQKLKAMFVQAHRESAVLLLDEADGFLRDRRRASQSWQVTEVNELLTQMESFDGLFICSTNLIASMDPAAFRRFDLKVRFRPIGGHQRRKLFEQLLLLFEVSFDDEQLTGWSSLLAPIKGLTLGDFVAVEQALRFRWPSSGHDVVEALADEARWKPGDRLAEA